MIRSPVVLTSTHLRNVVTRSMSASSCNSGETLHHIGSFYFTWLAVFSWWDINRHVILDRMWQSYGDLISRLLHLPRRPNEVITEFQFYCHRYVCSPRHSFPFFFPSLYCGRLQVVLNWRVLLPVTFKGNVTGFRIVAQSCDRSY